MALYKFRIIIIIISIIWVCGFAGRFRRQHFSAVWQQNDDQLILCVVHLVVLGKYSYT